MPAGWEITFLASCASRKKASLCVTTIIRLCRFDLKTTKTSNGRSYSHGRSSTECVTTTGHGLVARSAIPDPSTLALDGIFTAKDTSVRRVLRHFNLAQQFTQSGTVTSSVLSGNSNLLGALSHFVL